MPVMSRRWFSLVLAAGVWLGAPAWAAGKVVPQFTAYFTSAFTDAAYQKIAADKVLKAWRAPAGAPVGKRAVVIAAIGKEGRLAEVKQHRTTGFKPWDDAAMAAVTAAAPFPPLPKSRAFPTMEVHFHFEVAAK